MAWNMPSKNKLFSYNYLIWNPQVGRKCFKNKQINNLITYVKDICIHKMCLDNFFYWNSIYDIIFPGSSKKCIQTGNLSIAISSENMFVHVLSKIINEIHILYWHNFVHIYLMAMNEIIRLYFSPLYSSLFWYNYYILYRDFDFYENFSHKCFSEI